jgi:hypothetical protein
MPARQLRSNAGSLIEECFQRGYPRDIARAAIRFLDNRNLSDDEVLSRMVKYCHDRAYSGKPSSGPSNKPKR